MIVSNSITKKINRLESEIMDLRLIISGLKGDRVKALFEEAGIGDGCQVWDRNEIPYKLSIEHCTAQLDSGGEMMVAVYGHKHKAGPDYQDRTEMLAFLPSARLPFILAPNKK